MAHKFTLNPESLKRRFAVYVVLAKGSGDTKIYVGKTGDNRDGCNPLISRCGNHFSYNKVHSQVRNKIPGHEAREYTYIFEHFDAYHADLDARRTAIDRINEMERFLNQEVARAITNLSACELLNPHTGSGYVRAEERKRRAEFRTADADAKVRGIVDEVIRELKGPN